ncbi:hypothetical protein AMATHDRAFT_8949 [Amanita thiersii Skay4041]|uniref:Uncharacterized protein n=1 Tax=Amanita thiersii Skay4041 TaxID=703135 RepID=A0A2A9NBG1_9AGAR|nr:hypothetical protein AMATHDRAFT_8949 [Amanita thiersii Skay4041]
MVGRLLLEETKDRGGRRARDNGGTSCTSTTTTTTTMESGDGMEMEIVVKSASQRGRGSAEGGGGLRQGCCGWMNAARRRSLSHVGQHPPPSVGVAGAGATAASVQMQRKKKDEEGSSGRAQYGATLGLLAHGDVFGAGAGAGTYGHGGLEDGWIWRVLGLID